MRHLPTVVLGVLLAAGVPFGVSAQPVDGFATVVSRAMRYVLSYEQAFSLLVSEEYYVQQSRRPPSPGTNLSRTNPGGGMQGNGAINEIDLRSDYMLVQLGDGGGWLPFRDVFEVKGSKVRDREDRLVKLFLSGKEDRFDIGATIMQESTRYNLGPITRTINIPTLALMFLHPRVNERFVFSDDGEEMLGPRLVRRASYKEVAKPTLIKTTKGRDLALSGHVWFDQSSGVVMKTDMLAMDPIVYASVTVSYRLDDVAKIWVPEKMEEYYKAQHAVDEILATATYSNVRTFQKPEASSPKPQSP